MDEYPKLKQLLNQLTQHWCLWDKYEAYYLETLAPKLIADPKSGDKTEVPLLYAISGELIPEDWQNLPELIREFRAGGDRQDKCLKEASLHRQGRLVQALYWREEELKKKELQEEKKRQERTLQEREEARQLEEERKERERQLEEERRRDAEKKVYIQRLKDEFQRNFLNSQDFFQAHCSNYITYEEFNDEKVRFVQSWVKTNLNFRPDREQATAIGAGKGHVQVIARAGSGKTSTLVNRALFLQQHCGVSPGEMLLLAFNRKAAEEMRDRLVSKLQGNIPHAMTFHALAYALVHPEEGILVDEPDGTHSKSRTLQALIDDHLRNPSYYKQIRALMMAHFREDWERIALGGYDKSPKDMLLYRRSLPKEGIDGKYLKSFGEKIIADFLFEHDIKYKYERNFWWDGINYRPDFTIPTGKNRGVVIEYFGLAGDPDYDKTSEEKRIFWKKKERDWHFLEYSPSDLRDRCVEDFYKGLKQSLKAYGIICNRLSDEEIWHRIKERAIDRFSSLVVGFVQRCRKQILSPKDLVWKIDSHVCISEVEKQFLKLAQVFYRSYLERLQETGEEDFDGLMQKAEAIIASGQTVFKRKSGTGDLKRLQYVFVDEYQDFSELFYRLIKALRQQNPNATFFCVGDDWQAINGFAGSDLRFYENFEQFFQPSRRLNVATNYRSVISIVNISNELMQGRGTLAQAHNKETTGPIAIVALNLFQPTPKEQEMYSGDILTPAILRLVRKFINTGQDVVLLSRKNSLPWYVDYGEKVSTDSELDQFLRLIRSHLHESDRKKIAISTVHKYKGLEQKVVIILDAVVRCYPLIHPDLVFTRILGDSVERAVDEERRLFYVALTRAVESLFIVTENDNISPFLEKLVNTVKPIEWSEYPPSVGPVKHITVRVGNQVGSKGKGTYVIKDQLSAEGYRWNSSGWKSWVRTYPADMFTVNQFLLDAQWKDQADGIEVRFCDDLENIFATYHANDGKWNHIK